MPSSVQDPDEELEQDSTPQAKPVAQKPAQGDDSDSSNSAPAAQPEDSYQTPEHAILPGQRDRGEINRSFAAQGFGAPSKDYQGGPLTPPAPDEGPPPDQRRQQAREKAQKQYEADWNDQNPFKTSFERPAIDPAILQNAERESDQEARQAMLQANEQAKEAARQQRIQQGQVNDQNESTAAATGQLGHRDSTGTWQPTLDPDTGRPLYKQQEGRLSKNPRTGEVAIESRDRFGQRQFTAPDLVHNPDLTDNRAYYNIKGQYIDSGKDLEDFAQSKDPKLRISALDQISKRNSKQRQQALQAIQAATEARQLPYIQAQQQLEDMENQKQRVDALSASETDPVKLDAYKSQSAYLDSQLKALNDKVQPGGDLYAQHYAAGKELQRAKIGHVLQTYLDQQAAIQERLRQNPNNERLKATLAANQQQTQQAQQAFDTLTEHTDQLRQNAANRPGPVQQPGAEEAVTPFNSTEPSQLEQQGVKSVGSFTPQELAQKFGDGRGPVTGGSVLNLYQHSKDLEQTLADAANLDPRVVKSINEEKQYVDNLAKQRFARLSPQMRQLVTDRSRDPSFWEQLGGAAQAAARGAASTITDTAQGVERTGLRLAGAVPGVGDLARESGALPAAQRAIESAGNGMREQIAETYNGNKNPQIAQKLQEGVLTNTLPEALGSLAPFIVGGELAGGVAKAAGAGDQAASALTRAFTGITGGAQGGQQMRNEAIEKLKPELRAGTITKEQYDRAVGLAEIGGSLTGAGAMELGPVSKWANRIGATKTGEGLVQKLLTKAGRGGESSAIKWLTSDDGRNMLVSALKEGAQMSGITFGSTLLNDLTASLTFDPNRKISAGKAANEAGKMGLIGTLVGLLTHLGVKPQPPVLPAEAAPAGAPPPPPGAPPQPAPAQAPAPTAAVPAETKPATEIPSQPPGAPPAVNEPWEAPAQPAAPQNEAQGTPAAPQAKAAADRLRSAPKATPTPEAAKTEADRAFGDANRQNREKLVALGHREQDVAKLTNKEVHELLQKEKDSQVTSTPTTTQQKESHENAPSNSEAVRNEGSQEGRTGQGPASVGGPDVRRPSAGGQDQPPSEARSEGRVGGGPQEPGARGGGGHGVNEPGAAAASGERASAGNEPARDAQSSPRRVPEEPRRADGGAGSPGVGESQSGRGARGGELTDPAKEITRVSNLDAKGFREFGHTAEGGFTGAAHRVGDKIKGNEKAINKVRKLKLAEEAATKAALAGGDADAANLAAFRTQYYSDIYNRATGAQVAQDATVSVLKAKIQKAAAPASTEPARPSKDNVPTEPVPATTQKKAKAAASPHDVASDAVSDAVVNPEAKKGNIMFLARKYRELIRPQDYTEIQRVSHDRDMGVEDVAHELQAALNYGKEHGIGVPKEETPASPAPATEAQPIKAAAKSAADKLRSLKTAKGGLRTDPTLGYWDAGIELAARTIEAGGTVAQAIANAIKRARAVNPNVSDDDIRSISEHIKGVLSDYEPPGGGSGGPRIAAEPEGPSEAKTASHAESDALREKHSLPKREADTVVGDKELSERAKAIVAADPKAPDNLVAKLRANPSMQLQPHEVVMLAQHAQALDEGLEKSAKQFYDSLGAKTEEAKGAAEEAKNDYFSASDRLENLLDALDKAGSEAGRAFRARQLAVKRDFSAARIALEKRMANGGRQLTPEERTWAHDISQKIESTRKEYEAKLKEAEDRASLAEADNAYLRNQRIVAEERAAARQAPETRNRVLQYITSKADAAAERMIARRAQLRSGLSPEDLRDGILVAAGYVARGIRNVADFAREWRSRFGETSNEDIIKLLRGGEQAHAQLRREAAAETPQAEVRDHAAETAATVEAAKERMSEPDAQPGDLGRYAQKIALQVIRSGVHGRDAVLKAVHEQLKLIKPGITPRESRDAVSGYGKYKLLDPDAAKAERRDIAGQSQQISKLEDMQAGKAPSKTGIQQRERSDEERRLQQQVNEAMRRGGYQVTDPTKQLKASLDAVKTRMRNQISDLKFQIATGKKIVRTKTAVAKDPEALALEKQRDELQAQFDAIFTKPGLTDEQRLRMAERSVDRQIASVRDQINSGAVFDKLPKKGVTSPALDAKKAELEALRQEREYMRQSLQPSPDRTRDSIRNAAARASLARRSADIQARMARGDFSPKAKPAPMQVDPETAAAKEKYERTVSEYRDAIRKDILSKRNIEEKVQDTFLRFRRAFILARLGVFGKLGAAAVTRIASVPLEDVAGGITNAVLPKGVTKGAQYEGGGFRTKALADAAAGAWMKTIDDAVKGFKTGRDQMEVLHGDGKTHDEDILPPSISNYIGRLHKVFKAPAKRFVYEHSFSRRMQWHIENTPGFNPADVESQMRIGNEAYKDANRAIFMADNKISDWFQRQISQLNQVNRKTGHADRTNKAIATAAQFLVPIVKVPTNIAAETLNHAFGLAIGSSKLGLAGLDGYRSLPEGEKAAPIKERLARSFQKGFEALTPDQKDIIVRHFKKGLVGGAMMTLGYFNPNAFGGYYQYGEKRDKGDVKWGGARVMGHDIPAWALEAPIIQAAQMGATIRRVADAKFNQGNSAIEKIGDGAMAAALGVIDATPLMNTVGNLGSLRGGDRGWKKFVGTAARDVAVPGFVQEAAQWTDRDAQGNEIERQPKQFRDYVGEGVPGLRQQVPVKGGVKKPSYRPPTRRLFSTPQSRR